MSNNNNSCGWKDSEIEQLLKMDQDGKYVCEMSYKLGRTQSEIRKKLRLVLIEQQKKNQALKSKSKSIFNGYSFSLSGSLSKKQTEIEKLIMDHGGQVKRNPDKRTTFVVIKTEDSDIYTDKCWMAKRLEIKIIVEAFLHDSIKKNQVVNDEKYIVNYPEITNMKYGENISSSDSDNDGIKDKKAEILQKPSINNKNKNENNNTINMNITLDSSLTMEKSKKRKNMEHSDDEEPQRKKQKLSKDKLEWNEEECAEWIGCLGNDYKQYQGKFKNNGINGAFLNALDAEDLSDIVQNKLHRKKIMFEWKRQ